MYVLYVCTYSYIYIYTYIYIQPMIFSSDNILQTNRYTDLTVYVCVCVCVYIYIYIYNNERTVRDTGTTKWQRDNDTNGATRRKNEVRK